MIKLIAMYIGPIENTNVANYTIDNYVSFRTSELIDIQGFHFNIKCASD